jgi:hypothetical protein
VRYAITSRSARRFTAVLTVFNTGAAPMQGWALRWRYASAPRLSGGWNATVSTDAKGARATNVAADRIIPAGGSATIGFVGTFAAGKTALPGTTDPAQPAPSGFSLNGVTCR